MILFSTSLSPNSKTRELARSLANLFFGSYLNRGSKSFNEIIGKALAMGCSRACFVTQSNGVPSLLKIASVSCPGWEWVEDEIRIGKHSSKRIKQAKALGSSIMSKSKRINNIFGLEKVVGPGLKSQVQNQA